MKITSSDVTNILRIFFRLTGVINIILLVVLNHDFISVEIYNIFFKKEKTKSKKNEKTEEDDESEIYYSELLNDENIDKFLDECKIKFKNNVRSFYQLLINNGENVEDLFPDDIEILNEKHFK